MVGTLKEMKSPHKIVPRSLSRILLSVDMEIRIQSSYDDLGPVVKNVTFRNVGKNPTNLENVTNLGKLHYEYSPET